MIFRNHSNMLIVELLHIFVKTINFGTILKLIENSKNNTIYWFFFYYIYIINIFAVTFDQFNASLLNKSMILFEPKSENSASPFPLRKIWASINICFVNNLLISVCSYLCCSNSALDSFRFTVPDSLTSWVAFAIVMSENLGLGISAPAEVTHHVQFISHSVLTDIDY